MEIAREGNLITHKDLVNYLKAGDREGFQKGMIDQFGAYYRFLRSNPEKRLS